MPPPVEGGGHLGPAFVTGISRPIFSLGGFRPRPVIDFPVLTALPPPTPEPVLPPFEQAIIEAGFQVELGGVGQIPVVTGSPSPEAIAEGAFVPSEVDEFLPPVLPPVIQGGGGGGGPPPGGVPVELVDLIGSAVGAVRDIALSPGGFGAAFGSGEGAQAFTVPGTNIQIGAGAGVCPPTRPRMPSAVLAPNPCNPRNPTVYLKAGSVSSAVFPSLAKAQMKKMRKCASLVPRASHRRKSRR